MYATPARRSRAKSAMAEAEGFCRHVARAVAEIDGVDRQPELAALIDEAKAHVEALRKARINL
ncbi:MAG: hypothetical protein R6V11_07715 [Ectothiorhodospiraceae bacterium]